MPLLFCFSRCRRRSKSCVAKGSLRSCTRRAERRHKSSCRHDSTAGDSPVALSRSRGGEVLGELVIILFSPRPSFNKPRPNTAPSPPPRPDRAFITSATVQNNGVKRGRGKTGGVGGFSLRVGSPFCCLSLLFLCLLYECRITATAPPCSHIMTLNSNAMLCFVLHCCSCLKHAVVVVVVNDALKRSKSKSLTNARFTCHDMRCPVPVSGAGRPDQPPMHWAGGGRGQTHGGLSRALPTGKTQTTCDTMFNAGGSRRSRAHGLGFLTGIIYIVIVC